MAEVIGIDHIYLTVSNLKSSESFYDRVMPILGFKKAVAPIGGEPHIHYFCKHYGFTLRPSDDSDKRHEPYSPGLHHFCFRVESVTDVDESVLGLRTSGIEVSDPKFYSEYTSDYYASFFKDPDGIELEITNYREQRKRHLHDWNNVT